ncbi:MAG: nucleoside kinase [Erysipelotrichaceae bacterium]|nr:nucleoside kinase [Erysipelotrichaceae bacterium]
MNIQIDHQTLVFYKPMSIQELAIQYDKNHQVIGGIFNGKLHDLNYYLKDDGILEFVNKNSTTGRFMEERTLSFLFIAAVKLLYPTCTVHIEHTLSSCLFCRIEGVSLDKEVISNIRKKMQEMIDQKEVIHRQVMETDQVVAFFEEYGLQDKADLLRYRLSDKSSIYELCGIYDYFYGVMYPDVSYLDEFYLHIYRDGVLLGTTDQYEDQAKLYGVFQEYEAWGRKIGVSTVADLNRRIKENRYTDLILMCEAMVEKNLAILASKILHAEHPKKVILIAGPSSAGKTTFSKRLGIQLKLEGLEPITLSMDDFYLNREDTPRLPDGSFDFENIHAVDLPLFNDTINRLLAGESLALPTFDFISGHRKWANQKTCLKENGILIVEGIHALNPLSSQMIDEEAKFKIYINALTHLNYDNHNRIPTSDYRMIRRMVRDYQFRGRSAAKTIECWPKVEAGEHQYIYPYQEQADVIFNTSMVYEMSILKKIAVRLLADIQIHEPGYLEANRLRKLLEYFLDGDETNVPRNSILAEFIGNSVFMDE